MTITTTLDRLAESAVAARGGADLYRFALHDRIPDAAFARNSDGSVTVTGIDLLKAGTFNGFQLLEQDLDAMALRFVQLRDAGIFVPPFRLDHSWSVLSVVGYFENVETYRRVDATDSMEKTFLRGDVRLTGSVDLEPEKLVKAIKRGALRSRSSELGYYVTNSGLELPLVFYGCAFVDIPAVEGLAPVELAHRRPEPHSITNLSTTEGTATMDPEKLARLAALRASTSLTQDEEVERDELEAEEAAAGVAGQTTDSGAITSPEGDQNRTGSNAPEDGTRGNGDAGDQGTGTGGTGTPAEQTAGDRSASTSEQTPEVSEELTAARAEIARLRSENADRDVTRFRQTGILSEANEAAARTLLSHDSEDVRRAAGTLLGAIPAPVTLGRRQGSTTLSANGNGSGTAGEVIRLGMSGDEVGALWRDLTKEERKLRQAEYDAWRLDRQENGIRD